MGGFVKKGGLSKWASKGKQWTILCVGESGGISSFKLSKNILIVIGICVGVFLFVSVAAVMSYGIMKVKNLNLRSSLEAVQTKLDQTNEEKEELHAQLLILQEKLSSKEKGSQPSGAKKGSTGRTPEPSEPAMAKGAE